MNAGAGTIEPGGTLRFGLEEEPSTLTPKEDILYNQAFVAPQITESLVEYDSEGKPQPKLATSWKESGGDLTWTFQLRHGVKFSDGSPLTSEDVVFSLEQSLDGFSAEAYELVENVKATSPTTVVIETRKPMPALLGYLSQPNFGIVPDNYGGVSEKEFGQHPIGTGPFTLKSWHRGQAITLVKNPNYWNPKQPLLDKIVYTTTTEESARVAQLRGGELDMARVGPLGIKAGLAGAADVQFIEVPGVFVNPLELNSNWPPFDDPRIREAINLAIDKEGINQAASDGKGSLGASYMPPPYGSYHDSELQPPDRDVAKAEQLVAEAVKDGVNPSFTIKFTRESDYYAIAAQIVQQNLEEIGMQVKLEKVEYATLLEDLTTGNGIPAATILLNYFWAPDPAEVTEVYSNYLGQHNGSNMEVLDRISKEAESETNAGKRKQLYFEWQETLDAEQKMIILNYEPMIFAVRNLAGVEHSSTGLPTLAGAGFTH